MNTQFTMTVLVAVITASGGWVALWLNVRQTKEQRRKEASEVERRKREEREKREARKAAEDSETWYRESRENYSTAKQEAVEAKQECRECLAELRTTRNAIYRLLEDLEDQILPMLMFDTAERADIRSAMRAAVQRARESL